MNLEESRTFLRCLNCGYEWQTKSTMVKVTCPSCQAKVVNIPSGLVKPRDGGRPEETHGLR
jgi:Zn finger protein HypA/HybF involved in hydrogenase expression